ncbi:MAG: ATP-dependent RecD-like DNA helicase [Polyangiaceae bacterium]
MSGPLFNRIATLKVGEEVSVEGEVARVTYENNENGFRVLKLAVEGRKDRLTVVGQMAAVHPGARVRVRGLVQLDPRHGEQLKVLGITELAPDTLVGLERYLSSGLIAGIGPAYAARIVETFGLETLKILDETPERLREVAGLGHRRVQALAESWTEQRRTREVMLFLQSHGASPGLAVRIVKRYGAQSTRIVQEDPYRLSLDIWGVGFRTADRIAESLGIAKDSPRRVAAALLHVLRTGTEHGHAYLEEAELSEKTSALLEHALPESALTAALESLTREALVVRCEEGPLPAFYLPELHAAEVYIADKLVTLAKSRGKSVENVEHALVRFEQDARVKLETEQRRAVVTASEHAMTIITGGPGVGKTTIIKALLSVYALSNLHVRLAAPTGRAAKRMTEATGREASTLHRLLEFDPRKRVFNRNEENPLDGDVLVVDEVSMVDLPMAQALLAAVPVGMQVVWVGDVDQLASVGPGAVLREAIASDVVPYVRLTRIFRQAAESLIITNAHRINAGEMPEVSEENPDRTDFFIVERKDADAAASTIVELVKNRIPRRFGFDPIRDVQVLTPMHKGPSGSIALNAALQQALNPDPQVVTQDASPYPRFRVGDKVMQLRNDYDKGVWNGDVGVVVSPKGSPEAATTSLSASQTTLHVRFDDGREVTYENNDKDELSLAYACSIHKSQGSEYPVAVVVLLNAHFVMLSRNLLYTAVTRGKKLVVLVCDPRAVRTAIDRAVGDDRRTRLATRMRSAAALASSGGQKTDGGG